MRSIGGGDQIRHYFDELVARVRDRDPRWGRLLDSPFAPPLAVCLPLSVLLAVLVASQLLPNQVSVRAGEVARTLVQAPRDVQFDSRIKTEQARDQAAAQVTEVFDHSKTEAQHEQVLRLGRQVQAIRHQAGGDSQKLTALRALNLPVSDSQYSFLVQAADPDVDAIFTHAADIVAAVMGAGVSLDNLDRARKDASGRAAGLQVADPAGSIIRELASANVVVNNDAFQTEQLKQRARAAVAPVAVEIPKGKEILHPGQQVSAYDIEILTAEGLVRPSGDWARVLGTFLLVLVLLAVTLGFTYRFRPAVFLQPSLLALLILLNLVLLVLAKFALPLHPYSMYMIPVAAVPLLVATLIDPALAIITSVVVGLLVGIMADNLVEIPILSFAGSSLGILAMQRMEQMGQLLRAGFVVALGQFLALFGIGLLERSFTGNQLFSISLISAVSGFGSMVIAVGTFNFLGDLFGVATPTRLLELSNPNNPLLKRLMISAPGTYNHSLMVANLAESAADLVGANPLVCRLGAYFHDVGKTRQPQYFIENQAQGENLHETLPPATSAAILDSHVIEGVELVESYGFPPAIRDIVAQHQGTGLKQFFYRRALDLDPNTPEHPFRYPGPRPQTKEAALVMLADGTEASCRALRERSPEALRAQIERIVRGLVQDGQLDESDLTFRDVERIIDRFHELMLSIHHGRVDYPSPGELRRSAGSRLASRALRRRSPDVAPSDP